MCFEVISAKDELVSECLHDKGVCRTALATLGLLDTEGTTQNIQHIDMATTRLTCLDPEPVIISLNLRVWNQNETMVG